MEIKQEIFFYRLHVQIDESHWETTYMTIGKPEKSVKEVQQEAEDDFYFALSEFQNVKLSDILYQKLTDYGYQPIQIEETIYEDESFGDNTYAKKRIQAKIGEGYYDEDFKHRLNAVRIQKGKEPFPMPPKQQEKPEPAITLERKKNELDAIEDFDTFVEILRKQRDEEA